MDQANWWEKRWFVVLLIAASAIPLLWPETPPLVDVPGHMARYRVQLDLASSPELQRYFEFHWGLVANLGIDLLVIPLAPLLGLEFAVKLITMAIPPITVAGLLWIAREVHGRVPPTAMFAIPFVYGYPFNYGFTNFSLSLGLALVAFGLWLHLAAAGRFRLRASLFIPISSLLWLIHAFGWGVLGLLAYSAELVRHHDRGAGWRRAFMDATASVLPLSPPILFMIALRNGSLTGETDYFFFGAHKLLSFLSALRDRWLIWDSLGLAVALVLISVAIIDRRFEVSKRLIIPGAVLALTFVMMPARILGLAYADSRLAPAMVMIALLAIRVDSNLDQARRLAWLGFAFLALRLGSNTLSFFIADRESQSLLQALDHVPRGAAVLTLAGDSCNLQWALPRHTHLGSFVVIRRHGFSNDQWQGAGAHLLRVDYPPAQQFTSDRTTFIYPEDCIRKLSRSNHPTRWRSATVALQDFPRDAFDYVWMIQPPDFDMKAKPGLTPIWREEDAVLYKVEHEAD